MSIDLTYRDGASLSTPDAAGNGGSALESAGPLIEWVAANWFGGWDQALQALFMLMAVDYGVGLLCAVKTKTVDREKMIWGAVRKAVVLIVIGIAVLLDRWVGDGTPVFRTIAIYFYGGKEGLSVFGHIRTLGVPLPEAMREALRHGNAQGNADKKDRRPL